MLSANITTAGGVDITYIGASDNTGAFRSDELTGFLGSENCWHTLSDDLPEIRATVTLPTRKQDAQRTLLDLGGCSVSGGYTTIWSSDVDYPTLLLFSMEVVRQPKAQGPVRSIRQECHAAVTRLLAWEASNQHRHLFNAPDTPLYPSASFCMRSPFA